MKLLFPRTLALVLLALLPYSQALQAFRVDALYPTEVYVVDDPEEPIKKRWVLPVEAGTRTNVSHEDFCVYGTAWVGDVAESSNRESFTLQRNGFEFAKLPASGSSSIVDLFPPLRDNGLSGSGYGLTEKVRNGFREEPLDVGDEVQAEARLVDVDQEIMARMRGYGGVWLPSSYVIFIECSGLNFRKGGPLGRPVPGFPATAGMAHVDQDPERGPLSDVLRNAGVPWLLKVPFLHLLNMWFPVTKPTVRPLFLLDSSRVNQTEQLVHTFRREEFDANVFALRKPDVEEEGQPRWWYDSRMEVGEGVVFSTTETFHVSFSVPGEETVALYYDAFVELMKRNRSSCEKIIQAPCESCVSAQMELLLASLETAFNAICDGTALDERGLVLQAIESMTRESLEVRGLAIVLDKVAVHITGAALFAAFSMQFGYLLIKSLRSRNGG